MLSGWNGWIKVSGGARNGILEGVKVSAISSYLESCRYHLCTDEGEEVEERRRRESLLQDLRGWQSGTRSDECYHKRIGNWK